MNHPQQEPVDHFARAKALIAEAEKAQIIDTPEKAQAATAWVGQAKTTWETLDMERLELGDPLRDKLKQINAEYAPTLGPLKVHEERLRGLLKSWARLVMQREEAEQRRRKEEADRRASEEAARLESLAAEQRKRAEEAEAAGNAQRAAQLNKLAGQNETAAETTLTHAIETPQLAPVSEIAPVHSGAGTMSAQKEWDWEIEDIHALPNEYVIKTANKAAINAAVKKNGVRKIAGLRIFESAKLQIRR